MKKIILVGFLTFSLAGQAQLGGLLNKAKEKISSKGKQAASAAKADVPTDGISGPLHQKYMGKIVFAKNDADIQKGTENESAFISKFTLGEPVMFRVYMDNSLVNYLKSREFPSVHGRYQLKFYIDGADAGVYTMSTGEFAGNEKEKFTTWRGALTAEEGKTRSGASEFTRFLKENEAKLTMGDHKIKIEIYPYEDYQGEYLGPVVASGELTMAVKASVIDPNDPKVCLPKAEMVDKALEAKIVTASKSIGAVKEVRIVSTKWNIARHKVTGVITRRYVEAAIAYTDGGKCWFEYCNFYQDYDGSGYQQDIYLDGHSGRRDLNCKCMKP